MLPDAVVSLLWILIAIALPLVQSLHAIQCKDQNRELWLFYWLCYFAGSLVTYWFEWLIRLPFWVISFIVDIYGEAQLAIACFMILRNGHGIRRLHAAFKEKCSSPMGKMLIGMLCSKAGPRAPKQDGPGTYVLIKASGVTTTLETAKASAYATLEVGQRVEVVEVVRLEEAKRLRAKIQEPAGWISLLNLENNNRWAVRAEDFGNVSSGAMPGEASNIFANAAAAGCNPTALFQGVGSGVSPTEVSDEEAWEAMAMLESQISRADDLSEDAASRQASSMLRTMLCTLTQTGNPAMLGMAQAMMPDLGKIWANESTRQYLKELLASQSTAGVTPDSISMGMSCGTGSFNASGSGSGSGSNSATAGGSNSAFSSGGAFLSSTGSGGSGSGSGTAGTISTGSGSST